MNTNKLKSFATKARLILMEGVGRKLNYWGFNERGECVENMDPIAGGYEFREQVFNDPRVYPKWQNLKDHIKDPQTRKDVIEQAAYTWFNRLIAIKMLDMNGYEDEAIGYREGTHTPMLLQTAKSGRNTHLYKTDQELLKQYLGADDDENAFGLLLTDHCNRHTLLRSIFGSIDDFTELLLPNNLLIENGIVALINDENAIPPNDFKEVELIGWLYQFYITDRKDEVFAGFKKNKKARAEDIPAATQIFTPKWIVKYMVENTVGKLYLDFEPNSSLRADMKYLVETQQVEAQPKVNNVKNPKLFDEPVIAAKQVSDVTDLTLLDPACGSGHILVVAFDLLMNVYLEQGYNKKQAVQSILNKNIFGLDIDDRAAQLARFALSLKAASHDASILSENLHVHVYSFPEAHHFSNEDLLTFLGTRKEYLDELRAALKLLNQGKNIGSALKLEMTEAAFSYLYIQAKIWQQKEASASLGLQEQAIWNRLHQFIGVLQVLASQYTSVVANPPYMGQKSMNGELKDYVNTHYPETKTDLMTVFMEVIPRLTQDKSRFALINLPSWLFLSSFEKLRQNYIGNYQFDSLLHMGRGIFGIDFGSVAFALIKNGYENARGSYFRLHERNFQHIHYQDIEKLFLYSKEKQDYKYDFGEYRDEDGITEIPEQGTETGLKLYYPNIPQTNFSKIPGSPIAYWVSEKFIDLFLDSKVSDFIDGKNGMSINSSFIKNWSEVSYYNISRNSKSASDNIESQKKWFPTNKGGGYRKWYGNTMFITDYQNDGENLKYFVTHNPTDPDTTHWSRRLYNTEYHYKEAITWNKIASGGICFRILGPGYLHSDAGPIIPQIDLNLFGFLNSIVATNTLKLLSPTVNYVASDVGKLPFIKVNKIDVIPLVNTAIDISKKDWNCRETSWDFEKSPLLSGATSLKQSYQSWRQQVKKDFFQLHAKEEELNRIFIDIYGLEKELPPEVALNDITILQEELDRSALEQLEPVFRAKDKEAIELPLDRAEVMSQFISYAVGCMMGRYRLDKPGLNVAHLNPSDEELSGYTYESRSWKIDEDAIVPMMGNESPFTDDIAYRTKEFIRVVWGDDTLTENLNFLQECLGMDLEKFLVTKFWDYHKRMYKKRPIYWLFSSKSGAFQVLIYMHRMDKYTVQKIRQNYLHKYQAWLTEQIDKLATDEASLSRQDQKKLENYRKAQVECKEYDEILKELAKQQIEFDLDDGVVVNHAKFGKAVREI